MNEIIDPKYTLSYKCINDETAIWFEYNNLQWIVDPCVLFNGLLGSVDNNGEPLLYLNSNSLSKRNACLFVQQEHDCDYIYWTIDPLLRDPECKLRFGLKDFLKEVELSLVALHNDVLNKSPNAYTDVITIEEIEKAFNQFYALKLFLMPQRLRSSEVEEETLSFICSAIEEIDIPYTLRIGNRKISSYISDWSNDMDHIRYQLESYCYCRNAQIELNFEDAPTIINLQHYCTLASTKSIGSGIAYNYDDFVKVDIHPNSFVKGTAITGFCNERETVRELYEGLLNVGRLGYEFNENGLDNPWNYDAIVFYNHIKSPIIEQYISEIKKDRNSIVERQRIIHHVFTICPDYSYVLGKKTGQSVPVSVMSDDVITLYKDDSEEELCSVTLPGVYEWLSEYNRHSDGVESTMGNMDVENWHKRGLILAKELKKKLPSDIDVWYGYPFEDVEHRYSRPILITDGTLKEYFEEELSKACLKKDKSRIEYCLNMDADINANDGAAFKSLIASEESIESVSKHRLSIINNEKFELFELLLDKGLIINHGKGGINSVLKLCKIWKCDLIEKRIHEIMKN